MLGLCISLLVYSIVNGIGSGSCWLGQGQRDASTL